jgi:hypothetical protein
MANTKPLPPANIPGPKGAEDQLLFGNSPSEYGATLTNLSLTPRRPAPEPVASPVRPTLVPSGSPASQRDQAIAGEHKDRTNRYTAEMVRARNQYTDDPPTAVWFERSDTVQEGQLPQWSPILGGDNPAEDVGLRQPLTLRESVPRLHSRVAVGSVGREREQAGIRA